MAPISLADVSITSATPGVLVKGTVDPRSASSSVYVVESNTVARRIADSIDSSYIENADTAYWAFLRFTNNGGIDLRLSSIGDDSDRELVQVHSLQKPSKITFTLSFFMARLLRRGILAF